MADTPKQITVELSDGKTVELSMLPLKYYADLLKAVTGSIKDIADQWDGVSNDEIIGQLPTFIAEHMDEAATIVSVATRGEITKKDVLEVYGLADTIDIIAAAVVVNDVDRMGTSIKKAMAVFRKPRTGKHSQGSLA
jgi:hypothetical protein